MSLATEIVAALPRMLGEYPNGPRAQDIAAFMAAAEANVRRAMAEIKERKLAIVVRWPGERGRRLVPLGFDFPAIRTDRRRYHKRVVCVWCDALFQNGSKQFCSKSCFAQHMWSKPERREKGSAAGKRVSKTPTGKARTANLVALQRSPEGRRRLSERNRKDWADPVHKAKRSAAIQAVNGSLEARRKSSERFKENWQAPAIREKACRRMREVRADPEVKARYSEAQRKKWENPEYRAKMEARKFQIAEYARKRFKGKKRTPESIAKGKETRRQRALERGYWRRPTDKKKYER